MTWTGIIPARYASSRFPGKPLAVIADKPMIRHVYEQCLSSRLDRIVVATDDERIFRAVEEFGGEVVMTSGDHPSGTDRCGEAAQILQLDTSDGIVNIQGDEPFIRPEQINALIDAFDNPEVAISTLMTRLPNLPEAADPHTVKVIRRLNGKALYFSRYAIPFTRDDENDTTVYYKHIGIYAYRNAVLQKIIGLPESYLERKEKLEQLRWLENGMDIYMVLCEYDGISIDTPGDLIKAHQRIDTDFGIL